MRYILCLLWIITSCSADQGTTYKMVTPVDAGEQYLTITDTNIYYHGKVTVPKVIPGPQFPSVHFIAKGNRSQSKNALNVSFNEFQQAFSPLKIKSWNDNRMEKRASIALIDLYHSMWGKISGDSLILTGIKDAYDSRSDELIFIKK